MKKLTKQQKHLIKGGKSIGGIIQGISAIIYSISIITGYLSDYLMDSKNNKYGSEKDSKIFLNEITEKNSILS